MIINTARGTLIDSRALVRGLLTGKVAAAGLDVLPDELMMREEAELIAGESPCAQDLSELVADHVLLRMPNVVVAPHTAYLTREGLGRIVATSAENMTAFAEGRPRNVDSPVGSAAT